MTKLTTKPIRWTDDSLARLPLDWHADPGLTGLWFRALKSGGSWYVRHRVAGSSARTQIGSFPAMGLAEARAKAAAMILDIKAGKAVQAPVVTPKAQSSKVETLGSALDRYEAYRLRQDKGRRSLDEALATIRRELKPYLGRPVEDFTKKAFLAVRDQIIERGAFAMADRFQAYCGPFLKWLAARDLIPANFLLGLPKEGGGTVKRERVLDDAELVAVWTAAGAAVAVERTGRSTWATYGRLIRFLILTGVRLEEAAHMTYAEIRAGVWSLPAARSKNGCGIDHKLSAAALALVCDGFDDDGRPGLIDADGMLVVAEGLVFPGQTGTTPISGWSKLKARLDAMSGVSGWVQHDMRRTFATGLKALRIDRDVRDLCLNHKPEGVRGHYEHAELLAERHAALEAWAAHVAGLVEGGRVDNVVPLRRA
jgi:integrase